MPDACQPQYALLEVSKTPHDHTTCNPTTDLPKLAGTALAVTKHIPAGLNNCGICLRRAGQDADTRAHHLRWRLAAVLGIYIRLFIVGLQADLRGKNAAAADTQHAPKHVLRRHPSPQIHMLCSSTVEHMSCHCAGRLQCAACSDCVLYCTCCSCCCCHKYTGDQANHTVQMSEHMLQAAVFQPNAPNT